MRSRHKLKSGKLSVGFPSKRDEAVLDASGKRCESVLFDFSQDGGALGDILFGRLLPAGAIITRVISDEITAVVGATAVTLKAGSTALTASLDLTADAGLQLRAVPGTFIKLAADSELKLTIATAPASAGKVRFFVEYNMPNDGHA